MRFRRRRQIDNSSGGSLRRIFPERDQNANETLARQPIAFWGTRQERNGLRNALRKEMQARRPLWWRSQMLENGAIALFVTKTERSIGAAGLNPKSQLPPETAGFRNKSTVVKECVLVRPCEATSHRAVAFGLEESARGHTEYHQLVIIKGRMWVAHCLQFLRPRYLPMDLLGFERSLRNTLVLLEQFLMMTACMAR